MGQDGPVAETVRYMELPSLQRDIERCDRAIDATGALLKPHYAIDYRDSIEIG